VLPRQRDLDAELRLGILAALDELYYDTAFRMADVYADKLLAVLEDAQLQLMRREKMAALGGLVAGVAHEINTPMGVAVTAASLLRDRLTGLARDFDGGQLRKRTLADFLRDAGEAAELTLGNLRRASELVASFKQVAVDQSHATRRQVHLAPYLREVLSSLAPLYKRTPHRLEVDLDGALEAILDPGALSQIVTNLVQNALRHAFEGDVPGTMRLTLRSPSPGEIELAFADDGRGLSREEQRRLFEPFFTTQRGQGGSGLGMHIVHNLVTEALQGTIAVDSEPGEGTELRIRFPAAPRG
jgi:signal transduction histidine kinase